MKIKVFFLFVSFLLPGVFLWFIFFSGVGEYDERMLFKNAFGLDTQERAEIIEHNHRTKLSSFFFGRQERFIIKFKKSEFLNLIKHIESVDGWKSQPTKNKESKSWERIVSHNREGLISIIKVSSNNPEVVVFIYEY